MERAAVSAITSASESKAEPLASPTVCEARARRPARAAPQCQSDSPGFSRRTSFGRRRARLPAALAREGLGHPLESSEAPLKAFRAAEQATPPVAEIPGGIGGQ